MHVEQVPITRLFLSPGNPRKNDVAVPHVAASIKRFGWQQPIVARPSGEVIVGNTRLKAALAMKLDSVPVAWFLGTDIEAAGLQIADNRTHEFAEWDEPGLAKMLEVLRTEDAGLEGIGYSDGEVKDILAKVRAEARQAERLVADPGALKPLPKACSQLGDQWELEEHRIICGDSTKRETFERLLGEERVKLLSTDPPYCVGYDGNARAGGGKDWGELASWDNQDLFDLITRMLDATLPFAVANVPIYVWHGARMAHRLTAALEAKQILIHQQIIWVKPAANFGTSLYRWRHEPCLFGWPQGHRPVFTPKMPDTVWECDWEGKARPTEGEHPTEKPLRVFEIPMEVHTDPGQLVLEPFSGSGSQLMAATKLGRVFRGVELEPTFVDVAVRRWMRATNRPVTLRGDGRTFWDVAKERGVEIPA